MLESLLGRVPNLGAVSDFTTQTGNFVGTSPVAVSRSPAAPGPASHGYAIYDH